MDGFGLLSPPNERKQNKAPSMTDKTENDRPLQVKYLGLFGAGVVAGGKKVAPRKQNNTGENSFIRGLQNIL